MTPDVPEMTANMIDTWSNGEKSDLLPMFRVDALYSLVELISPINHLSKKHVFCEILDAKSSGNGALVEFLAQLESSELSVF